MAAAGTGSRRILAIDDDPAIRELLRELLEGAGYTVRLDSAGGGVDEALSTIRDAAPDLIVLDLITGGMPGGWSLLAAIRSDPGLRDTSLVVCSGAIQQLREREEELRRLGVAVVPKPFDIDHLLGIVAEQLLLSGARGPEADEQGDGQTHASAVWML